MATYLYRLGKFAYRKKFAVLGAWLLLLVLAGVGALTLAGPSVNSFSIPGTQGQQAQDLIAERFPAQAGGDPMSSLSARYVFAAPEGQTLDTPENQAAMDKVLATAHDVQVATDEKAAQKAEEDGLTAPAATATDAMLPNPVVADSAMRAGATTKAEEGGTSVDTALANVAAMSPLSPDKTVGYADVPIAGGIADLTPELRAALDGAAQEGRDAGLRVEASGTAMADSAAPGGSAELIGIAVAAVVLMITFGSLVAAGLPLITAIIGIAIGSSLITAASGFMDLSSMTPILAVMIGLAVAIDYALFIVSRFKQELADMGDRDGPEDRAEAAGRAVGTAGSAVVFAGLTVVIALVALRVVGIPFLSDMGTAAALTVLIAVLIALTLLPAILGMFGKKAFAGKIPGLSRTQKAGAETRSIRYARQLVRRPAVFLISGVVLLGVLALPVAGLKLALPSESTGDPATSSRQAYDLVDDAFGPGRNGPLVVVADAQNVADGQRTAAFDKVVDTIGEQSGVANVQLLQVNEAGDTAQILVTPESGPSAAATTDLVHSLRDAEPALQASGGVSFGVAGYTAMEIDISQTLADALVPYLAVVVGLAFVLLMLVFRSILVPLTATLGFLLSVLATFGATVAIFQNGWLGIISNPMPIVSFMPVFLIGVVFGLAMDYQVFMVSRMREDYVHGASAKDAVVSGFGHGARVVTAAAVIMMAVFSAFMGEDDTFIQMMGFALAAAVLFDAFVVRMLIIPAAMALLGDKAWWLPKWLDKILPNVDIEGSKLTAQIEQSSRESLGEENLVKTS
ncbi:MMPL family transporter [Tomitella biformata]|uniref:MMPL family transporter n=1 Tax=Tomitella biformata TaxID=630403 RepID=UPI000466845C|nr:MMPL family transporter [Tomitella biformata]